MSNIQNRRQIKCNNYRPITLLNIAYKITATLSNKRLSGIAEKKIGRMSNGILSKQTSYGQ
jgi:hypothetical protein